MLKPILLKVYDTAIYQLILKVKASMKSALLYAKKVAAVLIAVLGTAVVVHEWQEFHVEPMRVCLFSVRYGPH
jgi:hypothetical protein